MFFPALRCCCYVATDWYVVFVRGHLLGGHCSSTGDRGSSMVRPSVGRPNQRLGNAMCRPALFASSA